MMMMMMITFGRAHSQLLLLLSGQVSADMAQKWPINTMGRRLVVLRRRLFVANKRIGANVVVVAAAAQTRRLEDDLVGFRSQSEGYCERYQEAIREATTG